MKQLRSKVIFFNQVLFEEWYNWRNDLGDGGIYEKLLPIPFRCTVCEFWGQNSYKGGRNVIPVISLRG